jgi:hypothetical protein
MPRIRPLVWKKKQGFVFTQKLISTHFDPKYLGNTIGTLLNKSMASKNTKNGLKLEINAKPKNHPKSISMFLCVFKVKKKTQNSNILIIWNHLT